MPERAGLRPDARIVIVRLGALGDIIHALPAAAALRAKYPQARIDWVVDARHLDILNLVPVIDRRIVMPEWRGSGLRGALAMVAELRRGRYDAAVDLQGLFKSAVLARASGAPRVLGFGLWHLRERTARALYTETHEVGARRAGTIHVIRKNLALAGALGAEVHSLEFPLDRFSSAVVDQVRGTLGIASRDGFVTLNPGAAWPNKRWPPDRFGGVARALGERTGLRSIVLWGPGERQLAEHVVRHSGGAAAVAPATTLADLIAIADASALTISGDTGPLHIAAARGCAVVALFGPTNPRRNGPWNASDRVVSRYDECRCHYKRRCHVKDWCLGTVLVEEVVEAASARLAERPGGGIDQQNANDAPPQIVQ